MAKEPVKKTAAKASATKKGISKKASRQGKFAKEGRQ